MPIFQQLAPRLSVSSGREGKTVQIFTSISKEEELKKISSFRIREIKINDRINLLTVLNLKGKLIGEKGSERWYIKCQCECGKIVYIHKHRLISHKQKSCGCNNKVRLPIGEAAYRAIFRNYQHHARTRNIIFLLSYEEARMIMKLECYYCGLPEQNEYPGNNSKILRINGSMKYNGIDRLNNNLGYIEGNCVPCCKLCNRFKGSSTVEEVLDKIKRMYKYLALAQPIKLTEFLENSSGPN